MLAAPPVSDKPPWRPIGKIVIVVRRPPDDDRSSTPPPDQRPMQHYFVRIGAWGEILRCQAVDGHQHGRGTRVICRTPRGIECGQVTAVCEPESSRFATDQKSTDSLEATGSGLARPELPRILRATTAEDELLISRLEKHRIEAVLQCRDRLAKAGSKATLLEIDQVFDAGTLIFYFLDPPAASDTDLVQRLAESYESRVRSGHFAKLLAEGCGPGCGTRSCDTDTSANAADGSTTGRGGCDHSCAMCIVARTRFNTAKN